MGTVTPSCCNSMTAGGLPWSCLLSCRITDIQISFSEDASSSDEELKQIHRELSAKKLISQLNNVSPGRNAGGNKQLLGKLSHWFIYNLLLA